MKKFFRDTRVLVTILAIGLVLMLASLIGWLVGQPELLLPLALIGSAVALAAAGIGVLRGIRTADRIYTAVQRSQQVSTEASSELSEIVDKVSRMEKHTATVDKRVELLNPIIRNTAGSVGRLAPAIRSLSETSGRQAIAPPQNASTPIKTASPSDRAKLVEWDTDKVSEPAFDNTVMVIADEFTIKAFEFEWNQIVPSRESWRQDLDNNPIDFLFVESAWQGNDGDWKYQFTGPSAPRPEIKELVQECQRRGIPTAFWNKEDPPHFEDFLPTAKLFNYVFTSDINKIPEYREALGHDRISVLPFAAQPRLHNPISDSKNPRDRDVCFGGMYFRHKYPERREQMNFLLPAAAKFDLDIFSRQFGGDPNYQFPEPFDRNVRGALSYNQMLTAYKRYKVVLNVNSVVDSQSMCSRRIFEATASGATIVTPTSPALPNFYPDGLIITADNEEEAYRRMRYLIRSTEYRDRLSHKAQRHTWEHHTYRHRAATVLTALGFPAEIEKEKVSVITPTIRKENIENIFRNFGRQVYEFKELLICTHGFELDGEYAAGLAERYGVTDYQILSANSDEILGSILNKLVQASKGGVVARMDDDEWYGENYLRDMLHALMFSDASVVGKSAAYMYFEDRDLTILTMPDFENRFTDFVRGPTLTARKETFLAHPFPSATRGEDTHFLKAVKAAGGKIYAADRFNFSQFRGRDKNKHTWQADDEGLFGTGEMRYIGRALEQLAV